ncbi:DUF5004 domain-containing protein [Galbibacter sp.]|jgi:hypothetical protein|uniref:DUF5004 domain-containing protein n=1 Tax=Galbibacter sp. TaxID=2918471 RepID=UPI003A8E34EE
MKKQKLMAVVLLTALTGLFVGCNDDDTSSCTPDYIGALSAEETAFAGEWTLSAIVSDKEVDLTDDEEDNASTDIYAQQSECQNDQQYIFKTDRSFEIQGGENAADCDPVQSIAGTWKLGGSTLGLIYFCSENIQAIEFNTEKTSFSFSSDLIITDLAGNKIDAEVTFTYSKAPVAEETE